MDDSPVDVPSGAAVAVTDENRVAAWDALHAKYLRRLETIYASRNAFPVMLALLKPVFTWGRAEKNLDDLTPETLPLWLKELEEALPPFPPRRHGLTLARTRHFLEEKFRDEPGPPLPKAPRKRWSEEARRAVAVRHNAAKSRVALPTEEIPMPFESMPTEGPGTSGEPTEEEEAAAEAVAGVSEDETEPPPRRSHHTKPQPAPVMVMMPVAPPRQPPTRVPPRPVSKLLPTSEKIRISKRGPGGRLVYVGDYTSDDLQGVSLARFIKENIDAEQPEPPGVIVYEAVAVDANDRPKGMPSSIPVNHEGQPENPNDPLTQIRGAMDLVSEMRQTTMEESDRNRAFFDDAKKKAMGGGDMQSMMMLFMMEKMFGGSRGNDSEAVLKIAEKLGVGTGHTPAAAPVPLSVPWPPPPPPLPAPTPMDKLVEVMLAKAMNPPTFAEQLKELAMMRDLLTPPAPAVNPEVAAMRLELAALRGGLGQSRGDSGLEHALGTFETLSKAVKTLAPQLNVGGITGAIQSVMTPDLMKNLGNLLAQSVGPRGETAATTTAVPTAPSPQLPANTPAPAPQPTPAIQEKVVALRAAQTRPDQVAAALGLLQTMYLGPYREMLTPALSALMTGDVAPARQSLIAILTEARPDLNQPAFVDDVLREMVSRGGGELPATLRRPVGGNGNGATRDAQSAPQYVEPSNPYAAQMEAAEAARKVEKVPEVAVVVPTPEVAVVVPTPEVAVVVPAPEAAVAVSPAG